MKKLTIGLMGNPNSGKSTVFNNLTGGHAHVGNWPGVTVEKKEGKLIYRDHEITIVDLPGTYSLTPHSIDERIARDFIIKEKPDKIIVIVDSSNLERNLYLVTQLLELEVPTIVVLNMMDRVRDKKIKIDTQKLSRILGVPVIETVATKGEGMPELKEAIIATPEKERSFFKIDYGRDIESEIERLRETVDSVPGYPLRWLAIKLLEGDRHILETMSGRVAEDEVRNARRRLEKQLGYDLETALAERRYGFLSGLCKEIVSKEVGLAERFEVTDRIDRILLNRFLGIPIFLFMMWLVFQLVFSIGGPVSDWIDTGFGWLGHETRVLIGEGWLSSLIADGIIAGVGSVIVFMPQIFLLFLAIAVLEDSGYMARAAFVMDRFMHALGLHGKSFIPMLLGFGCNVPGIMATRTLESRKDRILTILVNPLISCSARLPIYTLFAGAFFAGHQGLVVFSIYLLGIVLAILVARLFKGIFFKGEVAPLIMELPPYRMPTIKNLIFHMWERGSLFLRKAGTIIFGVVVLIWLLSSLPPGVEYASKESIIGRVGSFIAPIFKPAGFGFWQAAVALLFGILAKEVVVGTLGTVYGVEEDKLAVTIQKMFTPLSAYSFMVMSLIYIPCIASFAVIKRETNWRWALLAAGYSLILGWSMAMIIYQIGKMFL